MQEKLPIKASYEKLSTKANVEMYIGKTLGEGIIEALL